jgi:type I restriction enzyme S subunit
MTRWPTKPLGELVNFIGGGTPRRDCPDFWGGEIPWASVKDLKSQSLGRTLESITPQGLDNSASNLIPKDTVIIASRVGLGKVVINLTPVAINQDLKALTPRDNNLFPRYLLLFLLSKAEYLELAGVGATVKGLTIADYQSLKIPVPPLAEQERIVRLLDEADELRKLRARADRRTTDLIPAVFHDMFGDPVHNSQRLPIVHVEEAGRVQLGRQRAPKYQTGKHTRPYVRVANVFEDRIDISDLLSMDFDDRDFKQYKLEYGDILLNEGQSTELVGRPAMWRNEVPDCCFQNTLVRFQADRTKVLPDYALALFLVYFRSGEFAKVSSKTSNVAHLGAGRLAKMPFVLPPLPLQNEFAARVAEIRAMEAQQAASRQRLDDLFNSMLHRAFQGKL